LGNFTVIWSLSSVKLPKLLPIQVGFKAVAGLHPEKTKIVYCKSWKYKAKYEQISFDFLGFTFRPRLTKMRTGQLLVCFIPAISQKVSKLIRDTINTWSWSTWFTEKILSDSATVNFEVGWYIMENLGKA